MRQYALCVENGVSVVDTLSQCRANDFFSDRRVHSDDVHENLTSRGVTRAPSCADV